MQEIYKTLVNNKIALEELEILNTEPEVSFDEITRSASEVCKAPIAIFSIFDGKRQWFKSKVGVDIQEIKLEYSLCKHAILKDEIFIVNNALEDKRFKSNPLITQQGFKFFACKSIKDEFGVIIGSLAVIDYQARRLNLEQIFVLEALAKQLEAKLSLRRLKKTLVKKDQDKQRFVNQIVHDLKNPIAIIKMNLEAQKSIDKDLINTRFYKRMNRGITKLNKLTMTLLDYEKLTSPNRSNIKKNSISKLFTELKLDMDALKDDEQRFMVENLVHQELAFDYNVLYRVIENLLTNAIKYAGNNAVIKLKSFYKDQKLFIFIEDNGKGLARLKNLKSQNGDILNTSHNIGLKFCQEAIQNLGGKLEYQFITEVGSRFTIILKV